MEVWRRNTQRTGLLGLISLSFNVFCEPGQWCCCLVCWYSSCCCNVVVLTAFRLLLSLFSVAVGFGNDVATAFFVVVVDLLFKLLSIIIIEYSYCTKIIFRYICGQSKSYKVSFKIKNFHLMNHSIKFIYFDYTYFCAYIQLRSIGHLKNPFGLEPVMRCEPSTYQPVSRWLYLQRHRGYSFNKV